MKSLRFVHAMACALAVTSLVLAATSGPSVARTNHAVSNKHASSARPVAPDFRGMAKIFGCSASLVRFASSQPNDHALMLTNGHCYQPSDKARSRSVLVDIADDRAVVLLNRDGTRAGAVHTSRVLYSTSFHTDVGLYLLKPTYRWIAQHLSVHPLTLAAHGPAPHKRVLITSGFFKEVYTCTTNGMAFKLFNDEFSWRDSIRLRHSSECHTIDGTSGSPITDPRTRLVLGVNNAVNVAGHGSPRCTFSLCEETRGGRITQHQHRRYGQQTFWITTCVAPDRSIDLTLDGCLLPKPPPA